MSTNHYKNKHTEMELLLGNCLDRLKELDDNSIDAIVTDPPYGFGNGKTAGFMGKKWDYDVPSVAIWQECLRVLKPGGSLLAFAGTRTQHRMAINIEDAGFVLKDIVAWVYGCLSEDSEVLTRDGWSNHIDAKGKDILVYDVGNDLYKWELPEKWYEYQVESDVAFSIRSEDTDQVVSRGHRCLVERDGKLVFVTAEELSQQETFPFLIELPSDTKSYEKTYRKTVATVTPTEYSGVFWCPTVSTGAFVARRNGKVFLTGNSGFPKSLNIEKALRKMGNVPEETIEKWEGFGSALKPSHEPNTWAVKPAAAIIELQHNLGALVCLSLAHVSNAENLLALNRKESDEGRSVSALMLAAVNHGKRKEDLSELMAMFRSPETGRIILSIAESWKTILAGSCLPENMSITKTESSLITELKILNSWILQNILGSTILEGTETNGKPCNASSAERILSVFKANYKKETFAQELATLSTDLECVLSAVPNLEGGIGYLDSVLKNAAQEIEEKLSKVKEPIFKYCAKAAKKDRNSGLSNYLTHKFPPSPKKPNTEYLNDLTKDLGVRWVMDDKHESLTVICPKDNLPNLLSTLERDSDEGMDNEEHWQPLTNQHATVKPTELMRWLCKLVTPEGGTVLDPFMGSGSTGVAALREGFNFVGVEMEPSYLEIAKLRIDNFAD